MNELSQLLGKVGRQYVIAGKVYPVVNKLSLQEKFVFSADHSLKHLHKSVGKIASELEKADHGHRFDTNIIQKETIKLFVSVLKLAEIQHLSGEDLVQGIDALFKIESL